MYECPHNFQLEDSHITWTSANSKDKPPENAIKVEIWVCLYCHIMEYRMGKEVLNNENIPYQ